MHHAMCSNSFRVPSEVIITLDFGLSEELTLWTHFSQVLNIYTSTSI